MINNKIYNLQEGCWHEGPVPASWHLALLIYMITHITPAWKKPRKYKQFFIKIGTHLSKKKDKWNKINAPTHTQRAARALLMSQSAVFRKFYSFVAFAELTIIEMVGYHKSVYWIYYDKWPITNKWSSLYYLCYSQCLDIYLTSDEKSSIYIQLY